MAIRLGIFQVNVCAACGTTAAGLMRMIALVNGQTPKIPKAR